MPGPHMWPSVALPNYAAVRQILSQQSGYPLAQLSADCAARADQILLHEVCEQSTPASIVAGIACEIDRAAIGIGNRAHHANEAAN